MNFEGSLKNISFRQTSTHPPVFIRKRFIKEGGEKLTNIRFCASVKAKDEKNEIFLVFLKKEKRKKCWFLLDVRAFKIKTNTC